MNDPRRWRGARAPSKELERLLSAGRPTRGMPLDVRARVASRLGAVAPAAALTLLSWKALAIAAGLGLAGVASAVTAIELRERSNDVQLAPPTSPTSTLHRRELASRPAGTFAPRRPRDALAPPPPGALSLPRPVSAPAALTPPPLEPAALGSAAPRPAGTLAREVTLLERARADLDADPAKALSVLDEHARAFPDGKLAIERELLAIDALDHLGRDGAARAERLLASARGTIYEARVLDHLAHRPHFR